ncbi:MAG: prepilin-type N-terminal cleavage/methylation domain-containing protein, partial [bacterium]
MILRKKRGVTFIELLIATAVISFAILGSINLLTRVYRDITSASMKTDSINIASEQIELLRSKEFTALGITPDSCITSDLGSLESCADNPHPVETIHHKSRDFKIYKIIQYCEEDSDGNLEPKKESQLSYSNPRNLKQIKVIVTYDDMQMNKTTELASFITNKEVPIAGTTISGRIYKKSTGGQSQPPGQASMATVYVVGHPEYTSRQYDDRGNYTLKNVQPGTYMLYASGLGFETTYYENNPIIVTDAVQEITDVDFLCEPVETAAIEGNVFIPSYAGSEKLLLNAAGSMTGQTSQWTNPLNIKESDDLYASISQNNRRLYTSFETYSETYSTITDVKLHIEHYSDGYSAGDSIGVQFTNDNGSTWASTSGPDPNPWNGNQNTNYTTFNMSASETTEIINITDLYENWSWDDINTLGLALRTQSSRMHYMDHAFLEIDYDKYDIDLMDNTIVMSHDGLSEKAEAGSDGAYKIENIDVSGGDVLITATSSHPSACYYKEIEDVPVTAGQTTNLDIILEECPPGVSILTGSVY